MAKTLIIFLFWCFIICSNISCNGQSLEDYHLMGGVSAGYKTLSLSDVNSWYDVYPSYAGAAAISGYLEAKLFKKNNLTFYIGYDYIPDTKRKLNFTATLPTDSFISSIKEKQYYVVKGDNLLQTHTATFIAGYDLPFRKTIFNLGAGITYNDFQITQVQNATYYASFNGGPYKQTETNTATFTGKGSEPGFLLKVSARYQLLPKLYASASLLANFAQIPLVDGNNKKILLNQSGIYIGSYYINTSTYLNADISGIQANIGLQYVIF